MKMIKASERMPDKDGLYHVKYLWIRFGIDKLASKCKATERIYKGRWLSLDPKEIQDIEWLDETASTPSHGRTAEEIGISNLTDEFKADYIDACSDNRKLRKMLAEVTGLSRIATVEEYSLQFKSMEEHRTQPQEGMEVSEYIKIRDSDPDNYPIIYDNELQGHSQPLPNTVPQDDVK